MPSLHGSVPVAQSEDAPPAAADAPPTRLQIVENDEIKERDSKDGVAEGTKSSTCQPSSTTSHHPPTEAPLEDSPQQVDELNDTQTAGGEQVSPSTPEDIPQEPPYCVLSEPVKVAIILTASFAAIISPISGSIYFPAINSLAKDLHKSVSLITLTITTYLVSAVLSTSKETNFS